MADAPASFLGDGAYDIRTKNPAARPGFVLWKREQATAIFGDDRSRTSHVELIAEAGLDLILRYLTVPVEDRAHGQRCAEEPIVDAAEIRIAVFGKIHQLLVTAYWRPPPTVQPTRVFEKLLEAKIGTPAGVVPASDQSVLKPPKATPPVA